ncbi:hypothetical protein J6590_036401 [Homalodisca vitripennis]|nr:hypothetical protein J6590_036401 [Homalodisca vitripennis]
MTNASPKPEVGRVAFGESEVWCFHTWPRACDNDPCNTHNPPITHGNSLSAISAVIEVSYNLTGRGVATIIGRLSATTPTQSHHYGYTWPRPCDSDPCNTHNPPIRHSNSLSAISAVIEVSYNLTGRGVATIIGRLSATTPSQSHHYGHTWPRPCDSDPCNTHNPPIRHGNSLSAISAVIAVSYNLTGRGVATIIGRLSATTPSQ